MSLRKLNLSRKVGLRAVMLLLIAGVLFGERSFFLGERQEQVIKTESGVSVAPDSVATKPTFPALRGFVPFVEIGEGTQPNYGARVLNGSVLVTPSMLKYRVGFGEPSGGGKPLENLDFALEPQSEQGIALPMAPRGEGNYEGSVNFLKGSASAISGKVRAFNEVAIDQIWKGIETRLRALPHNVEQIFAVLPGAKVSDIRFGVHGVDSLSVTQEGELLLARRGKMVSFTLPVAYQETAGGRVEVQAKYRLTDKGSFGFEVGDYASDLPLIIDPLLSSTYIGGVAEERFAYDEAGGHIYTGHPSIVRNTSGGYYVVATTRSLTFPSTAGVFDSTYNDAGAILENDVVIFRFNTTLTTLEVATYLGGESEDNGASIALDSGGNVYVVGTTYSKDFPTTASAYDRTFSGGLNDVFVSKLSADLSTLIASTLVGGTNTESAYSVAIGSTGDVFIVGDTTSSTFPATTGDMVLDGTSDGFVISLNSALATLNASRFLGGSSFDYARALKIAPGTGNLVITGFTQSANFPVVAGGYDTTYNGGQDGFVVVMPASLSSITAGTFVGHSADDRLYSLAIDSFGGIIVAGTTLSTAYPTTAGAFSNSRTGITYDAVVSRLNIGLTSLLGSTYFGGTQVEDLYEVIVDQNDNIFLLGGTSSGDLPTYVDAYDRSLNGGTDGYIARFNLNLTGLFNTTYFGGAGQVDQILSGALDPFNNLVITGQTDSANFPTTTGVYSTSSLGQRDLFVSRLTRDLAPDYPSHHMVVTTNADASSVTMNAGGTISVKVSVRDENNLVVPTYFGDFNVVFAGPGISRYGNIARCKDLGGVSNVDLGSPTALRFISGEASTTCTFYKLEQTSLDASIPGVLSSSSDASYDLDLDVHPGGLDPLGTEIAVGPSPTVVNSQVSITVTACDIFGNPVGGAAGANNLVVINITGVNPQSILTTDKADGTYSATYTPEKAGLDQIRGTLNLANIGSDTEGTRNGTFNLQVNDLGMDHYAVRIEYPVGSGKYVDSTTLVAGNSVNVTIFALDVLGNKVQSFDGSAYRTLFISGASTSPYGNQPQQTYYAQNGVSTNLGAVTLDFNRGVATTTLRLYTAENAVIDVRDNAGSYNSYADPGYDLHVTVNPTSVSHLKVEGQAVQRAGDSQTVNITARDQYGNINIYYIYDHPITFSGAINSPGGHVPTVTDDLSNPIAFNSPATLTFINGVAHSTMRLYARQMAEIEVSDGANTSLASPNFDLDVNVLSSGVIDYTTTELSTDSNPAGNCGYISSKVVARDAYSNQMEVGGSMAIFTVTGVNAHGAAVGRDRGDGSYEYLYPATNQGEDVLTATLDGNALIRDTDVNFLGGPYLSDGQYHQFIASNQVTQARWKGDISNDWFTADNWSGSAVPQSCYRVIIDGNYTYAPVLDHALGIVQIHNLEVGATKASILYLSRASDTQKLELSGDLIVGPLGSLTHTVNAGAAVHRIIANVAGNVSVAAGGSLDASGNGFTTNSGPGAGGTSGSGPASGGGHGGNGGKPVGVLVNGLGYGSITVPVTLGSGGGSCPGEVGAKGGGAIELHVGGNVAIQGAVSANGNSVANCAGGGAGGSIILDVVGELSGVGVISVTGGDANTGGGGGGGRIVLNYGILNNFALSRIRSYGGLGAQAGGAGSTLLIDRTLSNKHLVFNNVNRVGESTYVDNFVYSTNDLDIVNGAQVSVRGTSDLTLLASSMLTTGNASISVGIGSAFRVNSVGTIQNFGISITGLFEANILSTLKSVALTNNGDLSLPNILAIDTSTVTNNGRYNHSSNTLTVEKNSYWIENGTVPAIGNIVPIQDIVVKDATLEFRNQRVGSPVSFNTIDIKSGGKLTHSDNTSSRLYVLNLSVNNFTVERNGSVNLVGRGYAQKQGPGFGSNMSGAYGYRASGGGHGGVGGGYTYNTTFYSGGTTNDSLVDPNEGGSGGGCESGACSAQSLGGGGTLILSSPSVLVIDGTLDVRGGDSGTDRTDGGGAGGSVKISAPSIQGSGLVLVNGGDGRDGGGGGGRVAVYYDSDDTFNFSNIHAYGGYGQEQYGGAGTVFYKKSADTYGELLVDNNNRVGAETWLPDNSSFTFNRIIVRNGARLVNPPSSTLNLLVGQIIESTSNTLFTNKGILGLPTSTYTLDMSGGLTFRNEGQVSTVENLTLRNVRYVNAGIFSAGLENLEIGSGGIMEYANTTPSVAETATSIRVKSGGVLTHSANNSSQVYTLNLILDTLRVDMGGIVDLRGMGYQPAQGPGAGGNCNWLNRGCSGAGHASYGGNGTNATGGGIYGTTLIHPTNIGSGGGYETTISTSSMRGAGGGALKLVVDSLIVDGVITAEGGNGYTGANDAGGAGGSLWIEASSIKGSGSILANGGNANDITTQGGGSGGRISLSYHTDFDSAFEIAAYGGLGFQAGGPGTIFIKSALQAHGTLSIDNNGQISKRTILPNVAEVFDLMYVRNGTIWQIQPDTLFSIADLRIEHLGTAVFNNYSADDYLYVPNIEVGAGGTITHDDNLNFMSHQVSIWADRLAVDSGGKIDVTGKGYAPGYGATGGLGTGNSGGGYGGAGGLGSSGVAGQSYGSEVSPFDIGSGAASGSGGAGGGYIRLQIFDKFELNGDIIADGNVGSGNGGGGAGGSVLASVYHMQGQGYIGANGGNGSGTGGGGGGGRIAIFYFTQTLQTDGGRITSLIPGQFSLPAGGAGNNSGEEGTLYLAFPDHYEVTGNSSRTVALPGSIDVSFIDNHGNYFIFSGPRTYLISGPADAIDGTHPTCRNMFGQDIAMGGATILSLSNGLASCQMTLYKEESTSVDASDGDYDSTGNANWDLDVTVTKSRTARGQYSVLSATPAIVRSSNPVAITVDLWEGYGIPISTGGDTVVIQVNGVNTATPAVTDNGDGSYSASYTPITPGLDQITATVNGVVVALDTDGVSDGVFHIKVTGGPAEHFEITGLATQEAGTSQVITIYAKDVNRVTTTIYDGIHAVTLSGALPSRRNVIPTCRDHSGFPVAFGQPIALEFALGQAQCEMKLYRAENAEIEAEEGSISSKADPAYDLNVVVTAAAGLPKLSAEIDADYNPVERGFPATVIVNTQDIYGNTAPMNGRVVALTMVGPNAIPLTVTDRGDGSYSATYTPLLTGVDEFRGTIDGAPITADTEGVSDGVYHLFVTENVSPTHLEVVGLNTQLAGTSQIITISARDDRGLRSFAYTGDKQVTLSGPGVGPDGTHATCRDKSSADIPIGGPTTLTFTRGQARCALYVYKSEAISVDADDGVLNSFAQPSYDLDLSVLSGVLNVLDMQLEVSPDPASSGNEETIIIRTKDGFGNPTVGGHGVAVSVAGVNSASPVMQDMLDGSYIGHYTPLALGQDIITATVNGVNVEQDTDGVSDGIYHLDVGESRTATHFKILGSNSQLAGAAQIVTIEARDSSGQQVWSYTGSHGLTFSGPGISSSGLLPFCLDSAGVERSLGTPTVLTFDRGVATCSLTLYKSEVTTLDVTDGTLTTAGDEGYDLDIQVISGPVFPGTPTISATPRPVGLRQEVTVSVFTYDQFGNKSGSGDYVVLDVTGTNPRQLLPVSSGPGTYIGTYRPERAGTDNIQGQVSGSPINRDEDGISEGVFELPVLPSILPTHFEVRGLVRQHSGDSQVITIRAMDDFGNIATDYAGHKIISITGASASPDGRMPVCRDKNGRLQVFGKEMDLSFDEGVAQCELLLYNLEISELDATDGVISSSGSPAWGLDIYVFGADIPGINAEISATPNPVGLGHTATIKVQALLPGGTKLTTGGAVVILAVNQVLISHTQITDNGDGTYSASYLPSAIGVDLITGSIDGQTILYDLDGLSDGVYHLQVEDQGAGLYQIMGTVRFRDNGNSPAQGVLVTDGVRKGLSDKQGRYVLSGVPNGVYTIGGLLEGGYRVRAEEGVNPVTVSGKSVLDKDLYVTRELPEKVYAPWNGFLGNVVIVELFNQGEEDLYARLRLYDLSGKKGGELNYQVKPGKERDVIVNDMPGFEQDRYGVLKLELSHAKYNGQVSYYKLTPEGQFRLIPAIADDFDYAFPNPFVSPITGTSYVGYNTFQPSSRADEARNLVPNWLTVINGSDTTAKYFQIKKYDRLGQRVAIPDNTGTLVKQCTVTFNTIRCKVGPMGRVDIDGGHVYPGPGNIGTIEIIPEDLTSPYSANLVRYGMDAPPEVFTGRYSFAAYLQTRKGSEREQLLLLSTASGADNLLEITNVARGTAKATIRFYNYSGKEVAKEKVVLKQFQQVHIDATKYIGQTTSGIARVTADLPNSLIANNVFYYRDQFGGAAAVLMNQSEEALNSQLYGTYNTFLDTFNWLKIVNLTGVKRSVTLEVHLPKGIDSRVITLKPYAGVDLPLHDESQFGINVNNLGMFSIRDSAAGGVFAQILRVKQAPDGSFDFIMAGKVR